MFFKRVDVGISIKLMAFQVSNASKHEGREAINNAIKFTPGG
jgi:hypothetical protein